jgi:type I restriction enzyme R subunit
MANPAGAHRPDALRELIARDFEAAVGQLGALANEHPWLRPYQIEANTAVETAIAERKRQMLLASFGARHPGYRPI